MAVQYPTWPPCVATGFENTCARQSSSKSGQKKRTAVRSHSARGEAMQRGKHTNSQLCFTNFPVWFSSFVVLTQLCSYGVHSAFTGGALLAVQPDSSLSDVAVPPTKFPISFPHRRSVITFFPLKQLSKAHLKFLLHFLYKNCNN